MAWAADFQQFRINDYGLIFFTFWLSALGFTGMALFLSSIFRKANTASSAGLALLIFWFLGLPIGAGLLYRSGDPTLTGWQQFFGWVPVLSAPMQYWVMMDKLMEESSGPT